MNRPSFQVESDDSVKNCKSCVSNLSHHIQNSNILSDKPEISPKSKNFIRQTRNFSQTLFKIAVSVVDSDGPETYRSRCIVRVSADTQNKMINYFKNYKNII